MLEFTPIKPLETAVLFLTFNRLNTTKLVFAEIRKARPSRLYIASDGPRINKSTEKDTINAIRNYILEHIDWDCEIKTLFRDKNLGCKYAVSQAITWFFEHEEQGIILEDDCLPSQSFFWYCEELLNKYKDNNTINMISGNNFQDQQLRGDASYYFSYFPHIWGWASWARAWKLYEVEFVTNNIQSNQLYPQFILQNSKYTAFWNDIYRLMNITNTWDYQLAFTIFKNKMLCINPNVNLISNIGFGPDATHTKSIKDINSSLPRGQISHIIHPQRIEVDLAADAYSSDKLFSYIKPSFLARLKHKIKRLLYPFMRNL